MIRLFALLLVGAALLPVSCADTGGSLVPIEITTRGTDATEPFGTTTGWTVTLDEAWVAVAAFRAYADESLAQLLVPSRAYAHGGTDPLNGRRVRAEWFSSVVLDALDPAVRVLGLVDGETGAVDEVGVSLEQPSGGDTRGRVAWVRGQAERDGETVAFEGGLELEDEPLVRRVENITLEGELAANDRLLLTADPRVWLADAAFDRLPENDHGEPRTITSDSQVHGALRLGLRSTRAWRATIERNEE